MPPRWAPVAPSPLSVVLAKEGGRGDVAAHPGRREPDGFVPLGSGSRSASPLCSEAVLPAGTRSGQPDPGGPRPAAPSPLALPLCSEPPLTPRERPLSRSSLE